MAYQLMKKTNKFSANFLQIKSPTVFSEANYLIFSDLGEDRTLDPLIKSQLLYRLSYQVIFIGVANMRNIFLFRMSDFRFLNFEYGISKQTNSQQNILNL